MGMSLKEQIYKSEEKLNRTLERIKKDKEISENNKKTLIEYKNHCLAKGISNQRIDLCLKRLKAMAVALHVDFKDVSKQDIETIIADARSKNLKGWTIYTMQAVIKTFYRWLFELDRNDSLPTCVRWIENSRPPSGINKKDLLTIEEVAAMISSTTNLQYKTIISVLYEGSLRPGELMTITRDNVTIEEDHIRITVAGKTEKSRGKRDIYLFNSYDLLKQFIETHPRRNSTEDYPLWYKSNGEIFGMKYLVKLLRTSARKAGIKKRVYPYIFRHSRGTELYIQYGEAIAKKYMGHSQNSKMAAVYNHLTDDDVYEAMSGKRKIADSEAKTCPRCRHKNTYTSVRCSSCGLALTIEEASKTSWSESQVEVIVNRVLKNAGYNPIKGKMIPHPLM